MQEASNELESEVKSLRLTISDLYLKHRSIVMELQNHQDSNAQNKAEIKRLRGKWLKPTGLPYFSELEFFTPLKKFNVQ